MSTTDTIVKQSPENVKSLSPALPEKCVSALVRRYSRTEARKSTTDLAQGEIDILEQCRQALGWPTITSLAIKYYSLYPDRVCWKRALAKCRSARIRTATLNIKYLLLTVISCMSESLARSFNGTGALNRLVQIHKKVVIGRPNRLARTGSLHSPAPGSRQALVNAATLAAASAF